MNKGNSKQKKENSKKTYSPNTNYRAVKNPKISDISGAIIIEADKIIKEIDKENENIKRLFFL